VGRLAQALDGRPDSPQGRFAVRELLNRRHARQAVYPPRANFSDHKFCAAPREGGSGA
jgi:hypothetical protein